MATIKITIKASAEDVTHQVSLNRDLDSKVFEELNSAAALIMLGYNTLSELIPEEGYIAPDHS